MTTMNIFDTPAILRTPTWYGGRPDETPLEFAVEDYEVEEQGGRAIVRVMTTGQVVYNGIGPVEVVGQDVPF